MILLEVIVPRHEITRTQIHFPLNELKPFIGEAGAVDSIDSKLKYLRNKSFF